MIEVNGELVTETRYEWEIRWDEDTHPTQPLDYQTYDELEARQYADLLDGKLFRVRYGCFKLDEEEMC